MSELKAIFGRFDFGKKCRLQYKAFMFPRSKLAGSVIFTLLIFACTDSTKDEIGSKLMRDNNKTDSNEVTYSNHQKGANSNRTLVPKDSLVPNQSSVSKGELNITSSLVSKSYIKKEFFEDGSIKEEIEYLDNIKEGIRRKWHENGKLAKQGSMKEDRWHGKYEEWYEEGVPKVLGQYLEGRQDGEWLFFDREGTALPSLFFDNGQEITRKLPKVLSD